MKFIVETAALNKALKTIAPCIKPTVVLPILSSFKIKRKNKKTKIYATDLNLSIIVDIEVDAKEDFEAVIPFKTLYNQVSRYKSGLVTISVEQSGVMLFIDDKKFGLGGYENTENYPAINDVNDNAVCVEIDDMMLYAFKSAISCVAVDQTLLYNDIALRIDKGMFDVMSTDKLIMYKFSANVDKSINKTTAAMPTFFVSAISGINSGDLFIDEKTIKLKTDNAIFICRQTDEKYPFEQCDAILSDDFFNINCTINKSELLNALQSVLSFGTQFPFIDFDFSGSSNIVKVSFADTDFNYSFEDEIKSENPVDAKFRFNAKQLKSLIDIYDEGEVKMCFPENGYSVRIINEEKNLKLLIQSLMTN